MDTIGKRIRQLRKDVNMTQGALGLIINKDGTTVGRYENDAIPVPSDVLIALSKYFEISSDWILTGNTAYMHNLDEWLDAKSIELLTMFKKMTTEEQLEMIELFQFKLFKKTGKWSTLQLKEVASKHEESGTDNGENIG